MQLSDRELAFLEVSLDVQIKNNATFHAKVDAGEFPGYDAETLALGKAHNAERIALLERIRAERKA